MNWNERSTREGNLSCPGRTQPSQQLEQQSYTWSWLGWLADDWHRYPNTRMEGCALLGVARSNPIKKLYPATLAYTLGHKQVLHSFFCLLNFCSSNSYLGTRVRRVEFSYRRRRRRPALAATGLSIVFGNVLNTVHMHLPNGHVSSGRAASKPFLIRQRRVNFQVFSRQLLLLHRCIMLPAFFKPLFQRHLWTFPSPLNAHTECWFCFGIQLFWNRLTQDSEQFWWTILVQVHWPCQVRYSGQANKPRIVWVCVCVCIRLGQSAPECVIFFACLNKEKQTQKEDYERNKSNANTVRRCSSPIIIFSRPNDQVRSLGAEYWHAWKDWEPIPF